MFGFIKQQLAEQQKSNENTRDQISENKENDLIIECASLFQELDGISVGGQEINQFRDIDTLSIPLDEDPEIESFEISISDGRILDLPADILVHSESYEPMKSKEDFVDIARENINQGYMDDSEYNKLIEEFVDNSYNEYLSTLFQEGVFSAEKVDIKDPAVQWTKMVDFGPSDPENGDSKPYVVRMNIGYEKLAFNKILLKQKDSILMIVDNNADIFKTFGKRYTELLSNRGYTIPEGMNIWDIVTPNLIMVPVEPIDSFAIVVRAENKLAKLGDDKFIFISIKLAISKAKQDSSSITDIIDLDKTPRFASKVIDNIGLVKESMKPLPEIGRTIQETIDFGSSEGDNSGDATATVDGGGDATDNNSGDATSGDPENNEESNPPATETESNDVSGKIAEEVAKANEEKQNEDDATDAVDSADDGGTNGDGLDTATTDLGEDDIENPEGETTDEVPVDDTDDADSKLSELDAMGNENAETEENLANVDFSDMTPNQLTQAASEKIKNMTMSQIQNFLQSDDGSVTEAFVLTKKNINAELDASLRNCLGDLNDSSKSANEIMKDFKKDGKKLNKALSKASKMNEVYDENERTTLIKFNKCLADLIISFKDNMSTSEVAVVKRLIKAFASQAKSVGNIIEKHKKDTFQEAVVEEPELDSLGLPIREI